MSRIFSFPKTPIYHVKIKSLASSKLQFIYEKDPKLPTVIMLVLPFKVMAIIDKLVLTLISLSVR